MSEVRPHGFTRDAQCTGFVEVFVHDLDAMAAFCEDVFGLVPFKRHPDEMFGPKIDEIAYQATAPGAGSLTLIEFLDSTGPASGESVQGVTTTNIEALVARTSRRRAHPRADSPDRGLQGYGCLCAGSRRLTTLAAPPTSRPMQWTKLRRSVQPLIAAVRTAGEMGVRR